MNLGTFSEVDYLKVVLKKRFNVDVSTYRDSFIKRRLHSRMFATQCSDVFSYVRMLEEKPDELNKLLESLMINVSTFFRDPQVWPRLRGLVFEPLIETKARLKGILRVLSAGCSCGEEPYSIAITIEEIVKSRGVKVTYSITGIDLDDDALARARDGIYDEKELVNLPRNILVEYFDPLAGGKFRIKNFIKEHVRFVKLDLRSCLYPKGFDVVLCRNVLIYLSDDVKKKIIRALANSISTGGYLVLGLTESLSDDLYDLFKLVDPIAKIYRKKVVTPLESQQSP